MSAIDRFMTKVQVTESCWLWLASKNMAGYGQFWSGEKLVRAHRFAFEHQFGSIPPGLEIDHICGNRACVNPDHMRCVSHRENMRASNSIFGRNAVKTHCKRGHAFEGSNLYISKTGSRQCRACLAMHARNSKRRRREAA